MPQPPSPQNDHERVRRNVAKMRTQGAPEDDVRRYLETEDRQEKTWSGGGADWGDNPADQATGRGTTLAEPSRAALQGATFGFADEAIAAARSIGDHDERTRGAPEERAGSALGDVLRSAKFGENYSKNVGAERAALKEFRAEHPVGAIASEIAGGIGGGKALTKIPQVARMLKGGSTIGRSAGIGATAGAVSGAGASEGGLSDRARGAAVGGTLGAGVGAALPVVAKAGGLAADLFRLRPATSAAPATAGVTLNANPIGQLAGGARRSLFDSAEDRADQLLLRSLERDKTSPREIAAKVRSAEGAKPETIMDLAGENTRGLGRGAQSIPSKARDELSEALTGRQANQRDRVVKDLVDIAGLKREDVYQKADDLIDARRRNAAPLYARAYKAPPLDDPIVHETLALPGFDKAHAAARRIAEIEGVGLPPLTRTVQRSKANAKGVLEKVSVTEPVPQPLQALDYVKRAVDDVIYGKSESTSGLTRAEARALNIRLKEMLNYVDEQVPDYKAARRQFKGDSEVRDALEEGREFSKVAPEVLRKRLRDMSTGEKEAYRLGAAADLGERMEKTADGRDMVKVILGTEQRRQQMRALLGDEKTFERFTNAMTREAMMIKTQRTVLGGSPTARIQAEQADLEDAAIGALAKGSGPTGMALGAMKSALGARMRGVTAATADALSPRLTAGTGARGSDELLDALETLEGYHQKLMQRGARRGGYARTAGSVAGLETGRP